MAVDHHSASNAVPARKRKRQSKAEIKMALVAQRMAMLQSDDDMLPVAVENPGQCDSVSQNAEQMRTESSGALVLVHDTQLNPDELKICAINPSRESADDSSFEDMMTPNRRRRKGSHKRKMVISDDQSSEDRSLILKVQSTKKKSQSRRLKEDFNFKSPAIKRAEEVEANLSNEYPSFVKEMLRSHVTQGFWLGLPTKFCAAHLPSRDSTIVLVDEDGRECDTKFLAQKPGLSGGWRGFSIEHSLQEGDVVVFQLVKPTTFKVYIVRAGKLGEIDGALGLLNLDAWGGQWISEDLVEKETQKEGSPPLSEENVQGSSDIDIECEMVDGIRFSNTVISFGGVKSFESFNIVVDSLVMDSKFSENAREKYYELCISQGAFLHEHLVRGLNCNLVVGIISEIINIADAIKAYKVSTTSHDDLWVWEKTLKGFEQQGMNVSFLLDQLNLLLGLGSESDIVDESYRLREARLEQAQADEKIRALEAECLELKENIADAIKACKGSSTSHDDHRVWEKTLKGFGHLSRNVVVVFDQLNQLLGSGSESDIVYVSHRLIEARLELSQAVERMRALEAKFLEVKENMKEIELKLKAAVNASVRNCELLSTMMASIMTVYQLMGRKLSILPQKV